MQVVVVSNRPSRRTEFFCRAGVELGLSVHFMTYEELSERLSDMEDTVIKLEPVVSEESDFLRYARFDKDYREMLRMLGERPLSGSVRFLNTPASLLLAADKLRSKERRTESIVARRAEWLLSETSLRFGCRRHYGNPPPG